jgi:hypothetical protein
MMYLNLLDQILRDSVNHAKMIMYVKLTKIVFVDFLIGKFPLVAPPIADHVSRFLLAILTIFSLKSTKTN